MFYLLKRQDEKQCNIGDVCMVLADFSGIPAGTKGIISEIYDEGVMVSWLGMQTSMTEITKEMVLEAIAEKHCFPARGFPSDGFSRDELEYLAFETVKHPKI